MSWTVSIGCSLEAGKKRYESKEFKNPDAMIVLFIIGDLVENLSNEAL